MFSFFYTLSGAGGALQRAEHKLRVACRRKAARGGARGTDRPVSSWPWWQGSERS